jgi:integrase
MSRRGHIATKTAADGRRRYYVVTELPRVEGKRRQAWSSAFRTRRAAERALTASQAALDSGTYVEPSRLTFGQFLTNEWLPAITSTIRPNTLMSYRMHVESYIIPRLGEVPLQSLTAGQLNATYADLAANGRAKGGGPLNPATVRRVHATIHRALRDAARWGSVVRNVADLADPPRAAATRKREMEVWTAEQLGTFLEHVRDHRLSALWVLLATSGMRRNEALGVRWQDIDLGAARLSIRQTLVLVGGEVIQSSPKTSRGCRTIDLDPGTVDALRGHRKRQTEERLRLGPAWVTSEPVFTAEDGSALRPNAVSKMFRRLVADADLPPLHLHAVRHSWASLALLAGIPTKVVSERLGHSSTSFTADQYQHCLPGLQADAANRVAGLIFGSGG